MTLDEVVEILRSVQLVHIRTEALLEAATMIEQLQYDCQKWKKMAEDLIRLQEISQRREERASRLDGPRLVSYAPDGSTCTLNIDGEEHYYDRVASTDISIDEPACNQHPDAPHGFCRQASHGAGRYVCECEGWQPSDTQSEAYEALVRDAKRYRFFKSQHEDPEGDFGAESWDSRSQWQPVEDLDAAIDKAMEKA